MSLYFDYLKEKTNKKFIEKDYGFIIYSYNSDSVYIEDIYITQDFRKTGFGKALVNIVAQQAREVGINKMFANVLVNTKNSSESLKAALAYGFKLESSTNNFILLSKGI